MLTLREENTLQAASLLIPKYIFDDHLPKMIKNELRSAYPTRNGGLPVTLVSI